MEPIRPAPRGPERGDADLDGLLTLVARGDQAAFETVYDRVAAAVFGLVLRVLRDAAQSEEVAQEALLEVWRTAGRFDPARGAGAGLGDDDRAPPRRGPGAVGAGRRGAGGPGRLRRRPRLADEVAEAVESSLEAERVRRCLDGLTELQRESITLAYYSGLQLPAGRLGARRRARHGEDPDPRRAETAAGLPGGELVRLPRFLPAPLARTRWPARTRLTRSTPPSGPGSSGTCAAARTCPAEVRGFAAIAASLGLAAAATPPPALKGRVLADVAALDAARSADAEIAAVLSAPDARIASAATSAGGTATVVASRRGGGDGVHQLGAARAAAVFGLRAVVHRVRRRAARRPRAGRADPAPARATVPVLASGLSGDDAVGVTVEPAGGTAAPTTTPIVVLTLPADARRAPDAARERPGMPGAVGAPGTPGHAGQRPGQAGAGRSHFRPAEPARPTAADGDLSRGDPVLAPDDVVAFGEDGVDGGVLTVRRRSCAPAPASGCAGRRRDGLISISWPCQAGGASRMRAPMPSPSSRMTLPGPDVPWIARSCASLLAAALAALGYGVAKPL